MSTLSGSTSDSLPSWMHSPASQARRRRGDDDGSSSGDDGNGGSSDDQSDDSVREQVDREQEREPLVSAAISPSTGSSSRIRRHFRGPKAKRSCTDVLFLILFALYWVGMIALGVYAFTRESNLEFAKYIKDGVDYAGNACGAGRFVYFPDFVDNPDFGFCVDGCPTQDGIEMHVDLPLQMDVNGTTMTKMQQVTFKSYATHPWTYVCAPAHVNSEATLIAQLQDTAGRFVGALGDSWQVLVMSCGISLGTAFAYMVFLRFCGCFMLFFSALGIESILVFGSYRLLLASIDPLEYPNDPAMKSSLQVGAVFMCCSAILFFLMALFMLRRLMLAGTFITHASKALSQLKALLFVPFLSYVLLVALFAWGIIVTVCLFGAGHSTSRMATIQAAQPASVQVRTEAFQVNYTLRWLFLYHAWGMYWSSLFVLSIGEMITATAVSYWYFSTDDRVTSQKRMRLPDPVAYSLRSTFRFHLGTLAFSSATVSIVRHVRSFFMYLEDKNELESSTFIDVLSKCFCCCIWCFKYCLRYICKEALYVTAIQGTSFYPSAKLAYTLISSNLLRVGALNRIGSAAVVLGKLIVCSTTCFLCWFLMKDVSSPLLPLVAIVLFSYSVAHAFMTIYETTINTLLMCFTLDENLHGGRGNAVYASTGLVRSVNDHLRPRWQTVL